MGVFSTREQGSVSTMHVIPFAVSIIYGVLDLGFAIAVLIGSIETSSTMRLSPLVFDILAGIMMVLYLASWILSWIVLASKEMSAEDRNDYRFYVVHFFRCGLATAFTFFWGMGYLIKYDALFGFPQFILATDADHATMADVVGEDKTFIIYGVLLMTQLAVSIGNIKDVINTFHMRQVAEFIGRRPPITRNIKNGVAFSSSWNCCRPEREG